ncbi:TRAP transporter substrate-binding protein DctP [Minwuia sp.]|uniref:TRAP transporter substrate-binding protein DctP n=1 Tax=Minwuia sp. TaxID=2493630 RepID=UPI003A920599
MSGSTLRRVLGAAAITAGALGFAAQASAETTLVGASCFPQGSFFSKRFEAFVEQVNAKGKGVVQIDYKGGAPAIGSPFTLVQKQAQGVYDIVSCTGAYYQNVVPEADAWKLLEASPDEARANGGWDLMEAIHRNKNLVPISRFHYGTPFHLYLAEGKKIDKPDLTGLHLRVAPIYTNFFKALGATTQNSNLAQIYPLMENGTVAGYGWPITGLRPGWEKVTKYRVDPGFYDADINLLVNARSWDSLDAKAVGLITDLAMEAEQAGIEADKAAVKASTEKQAGEFEIITFSAADTEKWSSTARDAGWEGVIANSPENGPKLRNLFAKE